MNQIVTQGSKIAFKQSVCICKGYVTEHANVTDACTARLYVVRQLFKKAFLSTAVFFDTVAEWIKQSNSIAFDIQYHVGMLSQRAVTWYSRC